MIGAIIDGICQTLYTKFGYEIYTDGVKQGFKEPCFFVACISQNNQRMFKNRYLMQQLFCIQYYPGKTNINEMAEQLYGHLEYINTTEGLIRGVDMRVEIVDNILNFFVGYNTMVKKGTGE